MSDTSGQFDLRELFTTTTVGKLELTQVPVLSPQQTAADAAQAMREARHGSALVCRNGKLVGIITERDLMRLLADDARWSAPLSQVMTPDPKTVSMDDLLLDAVRWMDKGGYRRLPVVDADACPAGIVDVRTVVNFLVDQVPSTIYNQASNALLTVREREGA
jgi:CBS domain-containing protein